MRGAMSGGLVRVDDKGEGGCRVCDTSLKVIMRLLRIDGHS